MNKSKMRKRLENLKEVYQNIETENCLRIQNIQNYQPGVVRYTYGHYPSRKPHVADEEDFSLLEEYSRNGAELIILWSWEDLSGFFRKGILEPVEENGVKRFVDFSHQRGLKVLPYTSSSFLDIRDPNYNEKWVRKIGRLDEAYYRLERCCPGSPGWREYFLRNLKRLFEKYGFDGTYNDSGFASPNMGCANESDEHVHIFPEEQEKDLIILWEDFLAQIYSLIKENGGISVLHLSSDREIPCKKFYDYQLLGEGIRDSNLKASFQKTKNYPPYIVRFPCWVSLIGNEKSVPDLSKVPKIEDIIYAGAFSYLQFPWLDGGTWGEDEDIFSIPGVEWVSGWTDWIKEQAKLRKNAPPGTDRITNKEKWYKMLKIYKEVTKEGTIVFLEVRGKNKFFKEKVPKDVIISIFVNENLYISIANFSSQDVILHPNKIFQNILNNEIIKEIFLKQDKFVILRKEK